MTDQKCSGKLFIVHALDNTLINKDYIFTVKEFSAAFGCTINSAGNIFRRCIAYSVFQKVDGKKDKYQTYKLSKKGIDYGKKIKSRIEDGIE